MFQTTISSNMFTLSMNSQQAWQMLINFADYPQWNPFTPQVIGKAYEGATVELHVNLVDNKTQISREVIQCIIPEKQLSWGMHMVHPWLLKARRDQYLIAIDNERCTYHTEDHLSGILCPLVVLLYGKAMRDGFNRVGKALQDARQ